MKGLRASELRIRRKVDPLLDGLRRPPVDVAKIVERRGGEVRSVDLAPDVPGILYWEGERKVLVVNAKHAPVRQRLTLARMVGHLEMHPRQAVRVDRGLDVMVADPWVGDPETLEDVEADIFAMHLLMPSRLVGPLLRDGRFDFSDDQSLAKLAGRFGVGMGVLCFRLMTFSEDAPPTLEK